MRAHLYLIRGVPGSGKTTFARSFAQALGGASDYQGGTACAKMAADDWFDSYNHGEFDASKLHIAHAWCLNYARAVLESDEIAIVHNTFTTEKELAPYVDFAKANGIPFTVLVVENRHGNKSVHGVPDEKVEQMRNRLKGSIKL